MTKVILIILGIALAIFLIVIAFKHFTTKKRIVSSFETGNVMVGGPKGYGKDVLFGYIIDVRADLYFANYNYGGNYYHCEPKDLLLEPNDYQNFIEGNVVQVAKNYAFEGHDIYLSDCGVYLPSQMDYLLHKIYPSLPITYALNRHLFNNGIHVNCQRFERVWKALREQADYFIFLRKKCLKLPFFIVLFTTEYDRYDSARQELQPMKSLLFNKFSKAEKAQYQALHGFVKNGLLVVPKSRLKYDSRAFHQIIFGEKAPKKETLWTKISKSFMKNSSKKKND